MDNFWLGAIIISICVGALTSAVYGWLTFGGICLLAGIWEAFDDSIIKYKKAGKNDENA